MAKKSDEIRVIETGKDCFQVSEKSARRASRYGRLVRGWDWRTTPELLEKAETKRKELNLSRTEFLELAITGTYILVTPDS